MNEGAVTYTAGVCNIGAAEIRARRMAGWGGAIVTVVVWAAFAVFDVAAVWYWVLLLPAVGASSGFAQAQAKFCFNFGLRHVFNFSKLGSVNKVGDTQAIRLDRRRSWQIIRLSAVIAIAIAGIAVATA